MSTVGHQEILTQERVVAMTCDTDAVTAVADLHRSLFCFCLDRYDPVP